MIWLIIILAVLLCASGVVIGIEVGRQLAAGSTQKAISSRKCSHPDVRYEGYTWEPYKGVYRAQLSLTCCVCGELIFQPIGVTKKNGISGDILRLNRIHEATEALGWIAQENENGKRIDRWWKS